MSAVIAGKAAEILAAKLIDAAFMAFEANMARDELVARVSAEVAKGLPLDQVPALIVKMRDEALAPFKKP